MVDGLQTNNLQACVTNPAEFEMMQPGKRTYPPVIVQSKMVLELPLDRVTGHCRWTGFARIPRRGGCTFRRTGRLRKRTARSRATCNE